MKIMALILAAGKGTRMKSDLPKVLFEAAGKPMIDYVVDAAKGVSASEINVVIGNGAELVRDHLGGEVNFSLQETQRGTGDAVMAAAAEVERFDGKVLILCGDMPLIQSETLNKFIEESADKDVSFISVKVKKPEGYGRVVRGLDDSVLKIVEEKDASDEEKRINEVNTGIYLCDSGVLLERLKNIDSNNAQGEYYLTDIVAEGASAYLAKDENEFIGVNNRAHLANASKLLWQKRAEEHMANGVSLIDPSVFYCDDDVVIEADAVIYPNVFLQKGTVIRKGAVVYPGCRIKNSEIGENCEIKDNCLITDSYVGAKSAIGPMAQLRPGTVLKGKNKIGNFVETKKAEMGIGSKASHLTYLGDAEIGKDVNIGCGTITCNYDGISKYKTVIGDGVFVGSDVQLVAPVTVGEGALIAAGSTITKDVPADALGITRASQKNLEGWVSRWKQKRKK
ncbi:UDP-N-acetylglucosamine pyrophosphorylase [Denitrovibrio acetiphilus DSM 12809]|uniref:Bifunctional protein GlmU n=1 Tax=Denitrovibrio acetiphilus (strain DSM 12809 / NBRC 114555 / N2460) TaxID=522772 RepID=D4H6B2_DENA2|nr:bifunctional UDP-N-acetylglucosamine diphosphorylase/glucosamine-1-phosphate N-acetyltransferase GlmU [Denitrovibrio acetiphilus]ADD69586.1 UDP-N-acetylglucosamine pyrophosphorylase [Denitrovibrio acetiphilus DSM 12809]